MKKIINYLSLFTSLGTLICCALPALLVTLGLGGALASLLGAVPQLIWISQNKVIVFICAGVFLVITGVFRTQARNMPCPADQSLAEACKSSKDLSGFIYWLSLGLFVIGFFFAFLAPYLL